jgi:hypothetical protein
MCIKHILQKIPYIKNISYIKKHSPIIQLYECINCNYITTSKQNYDKHCKSHKECEITICKVRGRYDDYQEVEI